MKTIFRIFGFVLFFAALAAGAQTTSWKGTTSTAWNTAANWTAGVPTAATNAIIGDANFSGANQPTVNATATCLSLTIGTNTTGTSPILTSGKTLTVSGNITIGASGTIDHTASIITLTGNWTNSGAYTTNGTVTVTFAGASQNLSGATTFYDLTINAGSTVTLFANIDVGKKMTVSGTLDPNASSSYLISGHGTTTLSAGGTLLVRASTFAGNFGTTGAFNIKAASTINYAGNNINQTISSNLTYSTLISSNNMTNILAGNLTKLLATASGDGNIYVNSGTLDLSSFAANRNTTTSGGTLNVANGAALRIGGTNGLPINYATVSLGNSSTVEYCGSNQVISASVAWSYGNLLITTTNTSTNTFAAAAMTINGNFTSALDTGGIALTNTAKAAITVNGNVSIGAGTAFNGGTFSHSMAGNWTNNGTYNGGTSTVTFSGLNSTLTGTGANGFYNATFAASGITAAANTSLTVTNTLATTGSGTFTNTSGSTGTVTLSGSTASISGSSMAFNNLTVSGTATTASSFTIAKNLSVTGSITNNGNAITMNGSGSTISGGGTINFCVLNISGSISSAASFTVSSNLTVGGSLTASAGTATFNGNSTLSGTANLFNTTIASGKTLQLASGSTLGIAGAFTPTGTFNVTSTVPNTVNYNGSGAQNVASSTCDYLTLSSSGTATAVGALTVNGDLTIGSATTFSGGSFTHSISGNWVNNGAFTAGASVIQMVGSQNATISGPTTFGTLTVNMANSAASVTLNTNISVGTINMTSGEVLTTTNTLTITATRTGNGIILGTITRNHAYSANVAYAFESPYNTVTFTSLGTVSAVTIEVGIGPVTDFPYGNAINREYSNTVTAVGAYTASLRMDYQDAELNGNQEATMQLWNYTSAWNFFGASASNSVNNWVEQTNLSSINGRWTLSDVINAVHWNGSVSTAWENPANWTVDQGVASTPPSSNDVAELGTVSFVNQPTITSGQTNARISFGDSQAVTLTLGSGGSLKVLGNVGGSWTNSTTDTINVGSQSLTSSGSMVLSDGTNGHAINLSIGSGSVAVSGALDELGGANVTFTGTGSLSVGGDFNYTSGTFSAGLGTVTYNGSGAQTVAGLAYNTLSFTGSSIATLTNATTVAGVLSVTGGTLMQNAALTVTSNVFIGSAGTINVGAGETTFSVGGNWTNNGSFIPRSSTVVFNGPGSQIIGASTFNNLTVTETNGTATAAGALTINGNLSLTAGTFDLTTNTANSSGGGGLLTLSSGTMLEIGSQSSFPANFATNTLAASSISLYYGTNAQNVAGVAYGYLYLTNGSSVAKTLAGTATIQSDLLINSNATFNGASFTLMLDGNFTNNGVFTPATGAVTLAGASDYLSGATTFNNLTVSGSYTETGGITVNGATTLTGTMSAGSTTNTFAGNFLNTGTFTSAGTVTFSGTSAQNIGMNSGFAGTGTVNFNGTVSPAFVDSAAPTFQNVNINNTAGVSPALGWTVPGVFTVASSAVFSGGSWNYAFGGSFTNNGTFSDGGTVVFNPSSAATLLLAGASFTSSGTVIFGGAGAITMTGSGTPSFGSVLVTNTAGGGITPASNWSLSGPLTIVSGCIFNAGTGLTHTLSADFSDGGTFTGGTSTVVFNNSTDFSDIDGGGNTTFYNLLITGNATNSSAINVSGSFTNNGSYGASADVAFNGSGTQYIAGSTTPTPFDVLTISGSGTTFVEVNLNGMSTLTVSSGTLECGAFTVTGSAALTVSAGATLNIGGNNTLPAFGSYAFDPASTVQYNGSSSQTISAQNYGNLTSSSTGARTLLSSGTVGIAGTFTPGANTYTISGSTVNFNGSASQSIPAFNFNNFTSSSSGSRTLASSETIGIAGTFTPGGNTYTTTGSTINLNGSSQSIPAFTYNNLTLGGSGTATMTGNITVGGALTLASATLADGGFVATVNGNLSNTASHTGAGRVLLTAGSAAHVLSGSGPFNNMELNDANGASLSLTNLTINGALTLTAGEITTATNVVIISTNATVNHTNGYVIGSLQKHVAAGANITNSFEIGTTNGYNPISLVFSNVTTTGNLTAVAAASDDPAIASSTLQSNKSVNVYWTVTPDANLAYNAYNAVLNFNNPGDLDVGVTPASFQVGRYVASTWTYPTVGARNPANIQALAVTGFGDFEVAQSQSPVITQQPTNQTVQCTSNATLIVTLASSPLNPAYQWYLSSTPISNATNASLTLNSVAISTSGSYSVIITNSNGATTSQVAILTVIDTFPPVITLTGAASTNVECHTAFADPGATANDTCAGSLTVTTSGSVNTNVVATYTLSYVATDPSGNSATNTRTVNIRDTTPPVITLTGSNPQTVECHTSYVESGATENDTCAGTGLIVTTSGVVSTNTVGTYTVSYVATDPSGNSTTNTRTVKVLDTTPPVITLTGSNPQIVECHTSYVESGATENDTCAGTGLTVTTSGVVSTNTVGTYTVSYVATDSSGNSATNTRQVIVRDTTPPVITLNGPATTNLLEYVSFTDPGATANDSCAGVLSVTTIGSVDVTTLGSYTLDYTATDLIGNSATNIRVVVVVPRPPSFLSQPSSTAVGVGTNATFSVTLIGTPPMSYQWYMNGSPLANSAHIAGAASASLTLIGATLSDSGTYSVIVTNVAGSATSSPAILQVFVAPSIVTQPVSQHANAGDAVQFQVVGNAATTFYQWSHNGTPLSDGPGSGASIAGSATATLTLSGVLAADDGSYTVVLSNAGSNVVGTAQSVPVTLTVVDPFIVTQPVGITINSGATNSLSVTALGTPSLRYQWYFRATNGLSFGPLTGSTNSVLMIGNRAGGSSPTNGGDYCVTVANGLGSVLTSAVARITAIMPPIILTQPASISAYVGANVSFNTSAIGTSPLTYQWNFNGTPITGATNNSLTLSGIVPANQCYYQCSVDNISSHPALTSTNAHGFLTVLTNTAAPVVTVASPLANAWFTNGMGMTYGGVSTTVPNVVFAGTGTSVTLLTNVLIQRTYPPTALLTTNATRTVIAPGNQTWTNVLPLVDGTNTFVFTPRDAAGHAGTPVTRSVFLLTPSTLAVTNQGNGTNIPVGTLVSFAYFGTPTNGAVLDNGITYQIKAVPGSNTLFTNWTDGSGTVLTTNTTLTFVMASNLVFNANFLTNPIIAANAAGTYNGLFYPTNGIATNSSGMIASLAAANTRVFSGKIYIGGFNYTLSGTFDLSGNFTQTVSRASHAQSNLVVTLHWDWSNQQITGDVGSVTAGVPWNSPLTLELAAVGRASARYNMWIEPAENAPTNSPGGYGYATLTNYNGTMTIAGKLGDGVAYSQTVQISTNGDFPVYAILYGNRGLLEGWLNISNSAPTGMVAWMKPATNNPANYAAGFTNVLNVIGSAYVAPHTGSNAITLVDKVLTISGVDPAIPALTWNVAMTNNILSVVHAGSATNALTGSITPSTGAITLSYRPTGTGANVTATGMALQNQAQGEGVVILSTTATNTGSFYLR